MRKAGCWILYAGIFAGAVAATNGGALAAQPTYPERPIRLIIPQATGGGSDTIGRYITQKLGAGVPVVSGATRGPCDHRHGLRAADASRGPQQRGR